MAVHPPLTFAEKSGPFVKWAGGKGQLLDDLLALTPAAFAMYHEPFLGGGALFFALWNHRRISNAVLNDVNRELMTTYKVVRNQVGKLTRALALAEQDYFSAASQREFYYQVRDNDPSRPEDIAVRLILLNKTCYNGLYRVNRRGKFNVPFGGYEKPAICNSVALRAASRALRDAQLLSVSFEVALARVRAGDFVYLDPPYEPTTRTASFTSYTPKGFTFADQQELATVFDRLTQTGAKVMLSNSDQAAIGALYSGKGYDIREVRARRAINSDGARRGALSELVVRNYT